MLSKTMLMESERLKRSLSDGIKRVYVVVRVRSEVVRDR